MSGAFSSDNISTNVYYYVYVVLVVFVYSGSPTYSVLLYVNVLVIGSYY